MSRRNGSRESGGAGERSRGSGAGGDEEEDNDGNTDEDEDQGDQRGNGGLASPRRSRSSNGRNFRGYQPGDAEPSPVLQGVVNCLTSISNQMLRMSGKSGKNGGWPYFDGTFTGYPAFKRKWQSYYRNHHQLTPQRELVQLFRENCLHEKTADRLKRAESIVAAWGILDTLFDDPLQFTKDLIGDILVCVKIKDHEYEKLFDYYSMLQYTSDEADKANRGTIFLIAQNIDEMSRPLPPREEELWRQAKLRVQPEDLGPAFAAFLQERFEWSTGQVHGLRKTTTKPLLASSENRGKSEKKYSGSGETKFKKPGGGGPFRQAQAMVVQEGSPGVARFPPPTVWDPIA